MSEKIRAMFIFEILGKPPEYIKKALEDFVDNLGGIKGIKIINKKFYDPQPIKEINEKKESKGLFSNFTEIEAELDGLELLFEIILNKMPSHVEIIEPYDFKINNFNLTGVLNDLIIKLHKYDEIAKTLILQNNTLVNKIRFLETEIQKIINKKSKKNKK